MTLSDFTDYESMNKAGQRLPSVSQKQETLMLILKPIGEHIVAVRDWARKELPYKIDELSNALVPKGCVCRRKCFRICLLMHVAYVKCGLADCQETILQ